MDYQDLRVEYEVRGLSQTNVAASPFDQFRAWMGDAIHAEVAEPNAMMLATATADGKPSVRAVLLKDFSDQGLLFFTNYLSDKGRNLAENPQASVAFLWQSLHRQVRVSGSVVRASAQLSDAYFDSRPEESRRGAVASPQSHVVSEGWLTERIAEVDPTKRPEHWGGFVIIPTSFEFWQGQPSRLHDRIRYRLDDSSWQVDRLAP